jgi:hypothetical protein
VAHCADRPSSNPDVALQLSGAVLRRWAAVRHLLSGVCGTPRADMVRDIIETVREVANGLPPAQSDPFDEELPGG